MLPYRCAAGGTRRPRPGLWLGFGRGQPRLAGPAGRGGGSR